jgi:hypothetical protein
MIKFFRKIRQKLLTENKFSKYLLYAIGEIILVVIGILLALQVNISNQKRKDRIVEKEYYKSIKDDLIQDKLRLYAFDSIFNGAEKKILNVIDGMQLSSFNTDSLYSNVSSWMVYIDEFKPNNSTFTEIISSGKLQLFLNKEIKHQLLNLYNYSYPRLEVRQKTNTEFISTLRTIELMDTYRFMSIFDNDNALITNVNLNNPKVKIDHEWLKDKQSEKFLKFENYLNLLRGSYVVIINRFRTIIVIIENLITQLENEINSV